MNKVKKPPRSYPLGEFSLLDLTRCGAALRGLARHAGSVEEVAGRMVRYLYQSLVDDLGEKACSLVRFYATIPYGELEEELRVIVRDLPGGPELSAGVPCLTLLASAGEAPDWNSRQDSVDHRVIPLPNEQIVARLPMISQMIRQLGVDVSALVERSPMPVLDAVGQAHQVFYVPVASGSACIPAQEDFVSPYGIQSVVGFGGMLPAGDLFAVIVFAKAHISREVAALFGPLSLNAKLAVLPGYLGGRIFRGGLADRRGQQDESVATLRAEIDSLRQVLEDQERTVLEQASRMQRLTEELQVLATIDGLTGLSNRRAFDERFELEWRRAVRSRGELALLMIDIDSFKRYNDLLGHPAGDRCLRLVAGAIRGCIRRSSDLLARYGGEEFGVILPDTDARGAAHMAERIRAAVEALRLPHSASAVSGVVTVSVGVAACAGADSQMSHLIEATDTALYQAKAEGRNRIAVT